MTYISIVISSWHLDVVSSYLYELKDFELIIIVLPQSDVNNETRYRINNIDFRRFNTDKIKIKYLKGLKKKYKIIFASIKKTETCTILTPGGIDFRIVLGSYLKNFKTNFVPFDEGTSTYYERSERGILKSGDTKSYLKDCFAKYLEWILLKLYYKEKFYMLDIDNDYKINSKFRNKLAYFYSSYYKSIPTFEKDILILKDYDHDIANKYDIYKIYEKICQKHIGHNILIKKHPNDIDQIFDRYIIDKYRNVTIIQGYSAEELIYKYKFKLIYFGISTSGLVASIMLDTPLICFASDYLKLSSINKSYYRRIVFFKKTFRNVIKKFL